MVNKQKKSQDSLDAKIERAARAVGLAARSSGLSHGDDAWSWLAREENGITVNIILSEEIDHISKKCSVGISLRVCDPYYRTKGEGNPYYLYSSLSRWKQFFSPCRISEGWLQKALMRAKKEADALSIPEILKKLEESKEEKRKLLKRLRNDGLFVE